MANDMQSNKKVFYKNISGKRETGKCELTAEQGGRSADKGLEKAEILSAFFTSVFTGQIVLCVQEGNFPPLFCTGETTSGVLYPVLGSSVQDSYGLTGATLAKGHKDE